MLGCCLAQFRVRQEDCSAKKQWLISNIFLLRFVDSFCLTPKSGPVTFEYRFIVWSFEVSYFGPLWTWDAGTGCDDGWRGCEGELAGVVIASAVCSQILGLHLSTFLVTLTSGCSKLCSLLLSRRIPHCRGCKRNLECINWMHQQNAHCCV